MLRLTTFGALDLRTGAGEPVREVLSQPKRFALLAFLAVEGRARPVSRDRVLAMFWPESDASRARNSLSQALHHLRQTLGAEVIDSQGATTLEVSPGLLACDAAEFATALDRGELARAIALYTGEFCPALFVQGAAEVERWVEEERRRLRRLATEAAHKVARRASGAGDRETAIVAARRALGWHPEDEAVVRDLLALLGENGDRSGALLAYQEWSRRLHDELELEPEPATRALAERLRSERATAPPAVRPDVAVEPRAETPEVRLPTAPPSRQSPARRRLPWVGAVAGAGLFVLVTLTALLARSAADDDADRPHSVAVLPFTVRGGPSLAYLGEGMSYLLSTKLDGMTGVRPMDPRAVLQAADASALSADWILRGEVVSVANGIQVSASLYDATRGMRLLETATVSGDTSALFSLVDELAGRVLASQARGRDTTLARIAATTTPSLPALKAFLRGEEALRDGRDAQAAASYREAVAFDTTFALAHFRLAVMATWVTVRDVPDAGARAAAAERFATRLSPLARDLLAAFTAYKAPRMSASEQAYRRLVDANPENVEATFMLAEAVFHYLPYLGHSPSEGKAAFRQALALDPENPHSLVHLARIAALEGDLPLVDSIAGLFAAQHADAERATEVELLRASMHGDRASVAAIARFAVTADPVLANGLLGAVIAYTGDLEGAEGFAPIYRSADTSMVVRIGRRIITVLGLARGEWDDRTPRRLLGNDLDSDWLLEAKALLAAEPALDAPRAVVEATRNALATRRAAPAQFATSLASDPALGAAYQRYLLALLDLRLGDSVGYAVRLAAIESDRDPARKVINTQLARALRAEIARSRGDLDEALALLEGFAFEWPGDPALRLGHWGSRERFARAELLVALGRGLEALPWYESLFSYAELPYAARAHDRLAEILSATEDPTAAHFHRERAARLRGTSPSEGVARHP